MLPPSVIDVQAIMPRDVTTSGRGLLSETMCGAELRSAEVAATCHVARYREEFDETIRTVSEPECSKRRIDSAGTGSTRSVPDGRPRQGFSKGSASLQSLVRRKSRRHGTSLPSEVELASRQVVYPAAVPSDLLKDIGNGGATMFRNEEEARTGTPTSTLIYATSSAQPSTSRGDNNPTQDVSTSASNVATTTSSNVTSTTNGGRFGNAPVSLPRTTGVAKPGPSTSSSWNNSAEQESDYVVDPVQGNAYYKGQFLGKVHASFLGSFNLSFTAENKLRRFK